MPNCLAVSSSCCSKAGAPSVPLEEEVVAPWVRINVNGPGSDFITVGNESSPAGSSGKKNTAVIKSFQFGASNGVGCSIEIVDEEGGNFTKFFERFATKRKDLKDKYTITVQWGWTGSTCSPGPNSNQQRRQSQCHTFLLTQVQIKYESVMKFVLQGTDMMQHMMESGQELVIGSDKDPVELRKAIIQFGEDSSPEIVVSFRKKEEPNTKMAWNFGEEGKRPTGVWRADGQSFLATVKKWISNYVTENGKGIVAGWNTVCNGDTPAKPELILWEYGGADCEENKQQKPLRTYIVNGGDCSPVISFSPNIKWNWAVASHTGGFIATQSNSAVINRKVVDVCDLEDIDEEAGQNPVGAGTASYPGPNNQTQRDLGDAADTEGPKAQATNAMANANYESVTAELRIQGDPQDLDDPTALYGQTIALIVISPFHISMEGKRCEWLSSSGCVSPLTSSKWYIRGVSHDIREGSYTTTLQLILPAPGSTVSGSSQLGGC